jgi:hypothetical protein
MNHSSDLSRNATATAGPTPFHSPEKSGTQTCQHTAGSGAALLCNAIDVDTQKTKSLCCVAAGITALSSSTTEALIPHEKLREAVTHDATLIAQDCPPAQHAVGYTHLSEHDEDQSGETKHKDGQRKAQGFPTDYIISHGADGKPFTKTQQVQMYGNNVSPPPMAALALSNDLLRQIEQIQEAA